MRNILLIALGGAGGSVLRYLTTFYFSKQSQSVFPISTIVVNVLGCLLFGILFSYFEKHYPLNPEIKLLLLTGFCGGFTTFSAFSADTINLIQIGQWATALIYVLLSVILGLFAVWVGITLAK